MTSKRFQQLYGATPFDPNSQGDQIGESARRLLLDAALPVTLMVTKSEDLPFMLGGLLVGIVQILQAAAISGDEVDAAIRASIIEIAPWAVDMARSSQGKEPLGSA